MIQITSKQFTSTFYDIWKSEDRRFCFVLGAGASRSSGIRTGNELAKVWLEEIKAMLDDQPDVFEAFVQEHNIDESYPGAHYPEIYRERFKIDVTSGIDFINKEIDNKTPGYGYSVLAQVMAEKQHNIIVTTNFDNLVEEALYTYTYKRPLVCGHESLAAFAKPSINRPLIVKIHRDRFLAPQSLPEEIDKMNQLWVDALNHIFSNSIPVFIGYGGNDGSMMGYLEKVDRLGNLFWCERKGTNVSDKVKSLLEKHNGKLVEIEGFDELMFALQDKLGLKLLDKDVVEIAVSRAKLYQETIEKIRNKQAKSLDKDAQGAAERLLEKAKNSWWSWQMKADAAKTDLEKQVAYEEGLKNFPTSFELLNNYALFLDDIRKNYDEAEKFFQKALEINSDDYYTNCNYAIFLKNVRKNYDEAEKHYRKALELKPDDTDANSNYAIFLNDIRENYNEAEKHYRKALEIKPDNAAANSNYAVFLIDIRKNYNEAKKYYRKALEIKPNDAGINNNYAIFLNDVERNYDEAEKYYQKALEIKSNNADANGNYAGFLFKLNRNAEALMYLQKAFQHCEQDKLMTELLFYKYTYVPQERNQSFLELKNLLCKGVRSLHFNLQDNVNDAIEKGHPDPDTLQRLADILSKDAPTGDLCDDK